VAAKVQEWLSLVPEDHPKADRLKAGLRRLHITFQQAPLLGSLLDPGREAGGLYEADFQEIQELLALALAAEDSEAAEQALSAKGLMEAARLLGDRYHLVITNVPYRKRGDHCEELKDFCTSFYSDAKADLANVFLERCLELARPKGVVQIVMPQNWLFLSSYKRQRESLIKRVQWNLLARLGAGAFETINGEVVQAILLTQTHTPVAENSLIRGVDASKPKSAPSKAALLREGKLLSVRQKDQLGNPDARVALGESSELPLLERYAQSYQGITTGDNPRFIQCFWEQRLWGGPWMSFQSTGEESDYYVGREQVFHWEGGSGPLACSDAARIQGQVAWGSKGISVRQMGKLAATLNLGSPWDMNSAMLVPGDFSHLSAIWCFCSSPLFFEAVRQVDQALKVTNATLVKVPFDLAYWEKVAAARYPNGLPKPYSDNPTQWLFHGHPKPAADPLQSTLARLVGYRWPAETDNAMELSDEARAWIARCSDLDALVDDDGILPIPAMRGEQPAEGRLRQMLAAAFGVDWSTSKEQDLLQAVDYSGKSLEAWLRDGFFEQHCKLFHQRPFIWQVWDGMRDGFSVLVNYHKLDRKGLESLTYSYLGDWINRQKDAASRNESGAQGKLEKALELQKKLVAILEGEAPYDIFVRWKPLKQQPIGWEPDLNDGVRLNIRPFMTAGILRKDPKINWNKDRGTDVESAPWYHLGPEYGGKKGDRINDHHLSLGEKQKAREKA
jgi:hypothetical protein